MSESVDIAVVGAGTSGVVAAVAAARAGARVALVEATGRIGGVAVHGLHRAVCGLFRADGDQPGEPLHGPITREYCARLSGGPLDSKAIRRGRVWVVPFAGGPAVETAARAILAGEPRIRVLTSEHPRRLACAAGRIGEIELASGRVLRVKAVVDCTGNAALGRLAGAEFQVPDEPALAGYGFELQNVDVALAGRLGLSIEVPLALRRVVEAGRLAAYLAYTTWEPAEPPGTGWIKMAVPKAAYATARRDADAVLAVLKTLPAFRAAHASGFLPAVLPRETGHLRGQYVLTLQDVLAARKFPDSVARNAWPVERWDPDTGVSYRYLPAGDFHDIPRRCLQPESGPANFVCAHAAISADPGAAAAIRVMGVCMALGESAAALGAEWI